jgi:hypothetical protein
MPRQQPPDAVYDLYSYDPRNDPHPTGRDVELVRVVGSVEEATDVFQAIAAGLKLDDQKRFSFVTLASAYTEALIPARHRTAEMGLQALLEDSNHVNMLRRLGHIAYPPER